MTGRHDRVVIREGPPASGPDDTSTATSATSILKPIDGGSSFLCQSLIGPA
ncbi:hypothetical protein [Erythrobacter sp. 3-20A1M]|uniref:hypothetical protein n=1 Tax=Erythrobacter sp. 3-20A1M TaxID=2653850 RepID=UPI001BFC5F44|nr:hypothetical protein [Erythrobacter sp. 3-20A1M]